MRLFVAAPVGREARDVLVPAVTRHRDDDRVAWTRPAGWHVTLAFVGEVARHGASPGLEDVVAATADGAAGAGTGPVRLATGDLTTLAGGTALVVGLDDDPPGAVRTLGGAVQRALLGAGVDVAERRVWPHLTLARSRRRRRVPADLVAAISLPAVSWTVRHVEVVESVLGRGPAAYRTVATVPVGD